MNDWTPPARPTLREHLAALALIVPLTVFVHLPHVWFVRVQRNLDFDAHYRWAMEVAAAMAAGDPWPRWMAAANQGLGEPALLYYAPLYYLLAGALRFVTGNTWAAMQVVEVAATVLCGWLTWSLVRAWVGDARWALTAAGLAVLNPMLGLLHHGFHGYPWATAFAPLTLLLWALLRPGAEARVVNVAAILALAITICVHTISGLMGVVCVGALALRALSREDGRWRIDWRPVLSSVVTVAAGLLLSSAYLLPAIASQPLISADVWRKLYTPYDAFALPLATAAIYGMRWFAFQWPLALTAAAAFVLAGVLLRRAPPAVRRGLLWPGLLIGGTTLFLATELSFPLWMPDTPLRNVQFPHRFITVTTILVPMLALPALAWSSRRVAPAWALVGVLATHAALAVVVVGKTGLIDGERITVVPDRLAPYTGLDEYRLRNAGPDWTAYARDGGFEAECARAGVRCSAMTREGRAMTWRVEAPAAAALVMPVFAFPALQPSVNGALVAARADAATGLIAVDVPAGASTVSVAWQMLPTEKVGLALSAAAALVLAWVAFQRRARRPTPPSAASRVGPVRSAV